MLLSTMLMAFLRLHSQDVHFTQYDASPLNINPANTGNYDGFWRFSSNVRTQWRAFGEPFNTATFGFDKSGKRGGGHFSAGMFIISDQSGVTQLRSTRAYGNLGIHIGDENLQVHLGFQPGFVQKGIDFSSLTFPSQFDDNSGVFNNSLNNFESGLQETVSYFDLNLGFAIDSYNGLKHLNAGISVQHLIQPNESFLNNEFFLPMRFTFHGKYSFPLTEHWYLIPKFQYMFQVNASEIIPGLYVSRTLNDLVDGSLKALFLGTSSRNGIQRNTDAINLIFGAQFSRTDIGISYDLNISELNEYTELRGAFEISLVYWSGKLDYKPTTVICERL